MRDLASPFRYKACFRKRATAMSIPYVADRQTVFDADTLIMAFGDDAGFEAASHAERSRDKGNVVGFCRWRQVERLIAVLAWPAAPGTIH
jgi:hypothetical protein